MYLCLYLVVSFCLYLGLLVRVGTVRGIDIGG